MSMAKMEAIMRYFHPLAVQVVFLSICITMKLINPIIERIP